MKGIIRMKKLFKRVAAMVLASILACGVGIAAAGPAAAASQIPLELKRFIYSPAAGAGPNRTVPLEVEWGPELFAKPATAERWEPALAWLTSILANNAYFQRLDNDPKTKFYNPGRGDIKETLIRLGFDEKSIACVRAGGVSDGDIEHYNYVTFAQQTMNVGGKGYQLVAVMLRGTIDPEEWVSDFYLPDEAYVPGFRKAEQVVLEQLKAYLGKNATALPRKLLIPGHSRGAAVANLLGADLNKPEHKLAEQADTYVYTFATPNVAKQSIIGKDANIWNFVNRLDIVPQVPPSNWGYGKFGATVTLPADKQVEALFGEYSGLKAEWANEGINADAASKILGSMNQNKYNTTNFPKLKPIIKDVFKRDMDITYTELEKLNDSSAAFFQALFGFKIDFQGIYTGLKANILRIIVYQHTPETYVARTKVMMGPYLERSDDLTAPGSIVYSFLRKDEAVYQFVGARGAVEWAFPKGRGLIDVVENSDQTISVTSKKKMANKLRMFFDFLPFVAPSSFTIKATDEDKKESELTVNIRMPITLKLFGMIPFVGWYFFLFRI